MKNIEKVEILAFAQESADCIHITINDELGILIDTGKSKYYDIIATKLDKNKKKINYIIITHNHGDHLGAFLKLYDKYMIKENFAGIIFWMNEGLENTLLTKKVIRKIRENDIVFYNPFDSEISNTLFNDNIKILTPILGSKYNPTYLNKNSIVISIKIGDKYIILTGDATVEEEKYIVDRYKHILNNIIVVKLGHHGSDTSTCDQYISKLKLSGIKKVFCSCRSTWNTNPPNSDLIRKIENELSQEVLCTGRDGKKEDINIICEIDESGDITVS